MPNDILRIKYVQIGIGYYGGKQNWWGQETIGNAYGCGVIAATDYLFSMAPTTAPFYNNLGIETYTLDETSYMRLADVLWPYVKPHTGLKVMTPYNGYKRGGIGTYSIGKFIRGMKKFGNEQGWEVVDHHISNIESIWNKKRAFNKAMNFVKSHLKQGIPIQLLSWRQEEPYSFHWITITEFIENKKDNQYEITIATWGEKRRIIDFEKYWQYNQFLSHKYMVALEMKTSNK